MKKERGFRGLAWNCFSASHSGLRRVPHRGLCIAAPLPRPLETPDRRELGRSARRSAVLALVGSAALEATEPQARALMALIGGQPKPLHRGLLVPLAPLTPGE